MKITTPKASLYQCIPLLSTKSVCFHLHLILVTVDGEETFCHKFVQQYFRLAMILSAWSEFCPLFASYLQNSCQGREFVGLLKTPRHSYGNSMRFFGGSHAAKRAKRALSAYIFGGERKTIIYKIAPGPIVQKNVVIIPKKVANKNQLRYWDVLMEVSNYIVSILVYKLFFGDKKIQPA